MKNDWKCKKYEEIDWLPISKANYNWGRHYKTKDKQINAIMVPLRKF
mgnify:CR=1 FL=1